jgi:hypothetical protein
MPIQTYTRDGQLKKDEALFAPSGVVFNAYRAASQTAAVGWRKVGIDTKTFDPYGWFDTTNNRWQPKVPGYYNLAGSVYYSASAGETAIGFYKNGALFQEPQDLPGILGANGAIQNASCLMYLNGSTDYAELFGYTQNSVTFNASSGVPMFSGSLVASSVGVAPEPWHIIGASGEPAFLNGWTNQGSQATGAFFKDPASMVQLRGYLTAVANSTVVNLPAGYRPAAILEGTLNYWTGTANAAGRWQVGTNGDVKVFNNANGAPTAGWIYTLNDIHFRAEQ